MTLRDLIDQLTDLADEHGDQLEVRLAQQPRWAFEYQLADVAVVGPHERAEADEDDDEDGDSSEPPVVYLAEGRQIGYLPGAAAHALGWGRR